MPHSGNEKIVLARRTGGAAYDNAHNTLYLAYLAVGLGLEKTAIFHFEDVRRQ